MLVVVHVYNKEHLAWCHITPPLVWLYVLGQVPHHDNTNSRLLWVTRHRGSGILLPADTAIYDTYIHITQYTEALYVNLQQRGP